MNAIDKGTLVHSLLQDLDFRRPVVPPGTPDEIATLLQAFIAGDIRTRLAAATDVRREQRFAFPLAGTLITGTFDVLARDPERPGRAIVVDYKTGQFAPYDLQRLIYAIAALRTGVTEVEVIHLFLGAQQVVEQTYEVQSLPRLQDGLATLVAGVLAYDFPVAPEPHRGLCAGCPAAGGLCSWPLELTLRSSTDRLF